MNRRRFLAAAPLGAIALAGCSAQQKATFGTFTSALYVDIHTVAQKLEAAARIAATDIQAAVDMMLPYVVPCCRLVVSMDSLLGQLINSKTLDPSKQTVATAKTTLDGLASNAFVSQTAQTGVLPSAADAVTIVTAIVQGVALIMSLTGGKVAPVAAANA